MNTKLMFSSATEKWDTPPELIADLKTVFNFDLDVCASRPNVCEIYYDESICGLRNSWFDSCWMNPPYGRDIRNWIGKAAVESGSLGDAKHVICLVPARTDTRWWQDYIEFASHVVFIKGRLKFGGAKNSAPFPSAFIVFGEINQEQKDKLFSYGWGISQ